MNLLWLSHFVPYPPHGGMLQRSHHLLRLAAEQSRVTLVSLNQSALLGDGLSIAEAVTALESICESVTVFSIPSEASRLRWMGMVGLNYFTSVPYSERWLSSGPMRTHLGGLAQERTWDLVHVDTIGLAPYTTCFPRTPFVLNHHNVESQMMARRAARERHFLRRVYFRREAAKLARAEKAWCPRAGTNLVVSELDRQRLSGVVGRVPSFVVPNGVDVEYFSPPEDSRREPRHLVFVGGMDWYPNREAVRFIVEEIWPKLAIEDADWRLTLIGRNPPESVLQLARDDSRVCAPGFVEDVRPYLHQAQVYVCPIRDGGGTRLKVLDALASGTPFVATSLSVEGLDMTDEEHYLRAETSDEFVSAVRRLAQDSELRDRLASAGRRLVSGRFAWPVVGRRLHDGYHAAIQSDEDAEGATATIRG